jgi:hypothetical protein
MVAMVLTQQYFSLSGTDLKSYVKKAELTTDVEEQDVTTMASLGWKEVIGGLKSGSVALEFIQSFTAAELDAILWPLFGTVVAFETRPTQSAVGAGNPKYTGNLLVKSHNPITGGVGDTATMSVTFPTSGAVTRATS